jgi:hypothetical protein
VSEPRIFMLGDGGGREETPERYEQRSGEPLNPEWITKATEIAPGVRVLVLSTGGGSFGARVAVWRGSETPADRAALLGKRVRVTLDEAVVVEGRLLGFGDGGNFEIEQDDGFVYHAWPMLAIEEVPGA